MKRAFGGGMTSRGRTGFSPIMNGSGRRRMSMKGVMKFCDITFGEEWFTVEWMWSWAPFFLGEMKEGNSRS